ncbi:outer membrane protein OmpK [Methylomonas montana]|uniref:outer membrane protein OmpK n=1 Tax=Methylomonas montana TaxID=3058963 RepID=UPI00265B2F5D|nr:outer membrane protein OmpK [Methylomonas montana]WKJ91574.1 outer membrane protein OmpK [Methylomonas montana]
MPDSPRSTQLNATLMAAALVLPASPYAADFMQWSNSEIQYLHGANYNEPFNPQDVSQSIITITHAHGWAYGRNFFFMDTLFSEAGQPSQINLYGEAYSTFSVGKILERDLSFGILKDFGVTGGVNLGENMDNRQSGFRAWLYGVTVDLDLPGFDYFNIDFLRQRVTETADIGTSWQITPVWKLPFQIAGTKWSLEGFADFIGSNHTAARQALAQPQLRLDIGDFWGNGNHLYLGIEYQYWHNKYGIKGLHDNAPQALLLWKF